MADQYDPKNPKKGGVNGDIRKRLEGDHSSARKGGSTGRK